MFSFFATFQSSPQVSYIIVMCFCVAGIIYLLKHVLKYLKTRNWKITNAVIVDSKINKIDDSEGTLFEPFISYKYSVGQTEYLSNQIYPYDNFNKSSFEFIPERIINQNRKGQIVKIFFNPSNPNESCISKKGLLIYQILIVSFVLIFIFMMTALFGLINLG